LAPERARDPEVPLANGVDGLVPHEGHLCGGQGAQAGVKGVELGRLQIGDVTGNVKRHDLALAGRGRLVRGGIAIEKQAGPRGAIALAHDVLVGAKGLDLHRHREQGRHFLLGESKALTFEFSDERVLVHGWLLACIEREHARSQSPTPGTHGRQCASISRTERRTLT
jgi:hypothetical protein